MQAAGSLDLLNLARKGEVSELAKSFPYNT